MSSLGLCVCVISQSVCPVSSQQPIISCFPGICLWDCSRSGAVSSHGTHLFFSGAPNLMSIEPFPLVLSQMRQKAVSPAAPLRPECWMHAPSFFPPKGFRSFLPIAVRCAWGGEGLGQVKCTFLPISVPDLLGFVERCKLFTGFWNSHKGSLVHILL